MTPASLTSHSHQYCRRCLRLLTEFGSNPILYDGHMHHFTCAMRTILEKSLHPKPHNPNQGDPNGTAQ